MTKLILNQIIKDKNLDFNDLPNDWWNLWYEKDSFNVLLRFSEKKELYNYQKEALKNAIILLKLFFENYPNKNISELKKNFWNNYKNYENTENWNKEISKDEIILRDYFYLEEKINKKWNKIEIFPFYNICNRMAFWMATWSWKSIVIIKLISIVFELINLWKIPNKNFLFIAPTDKIIEQIKEHIEEFNSNSEIQINFIPLKNFEKEKNNNQIKFFKEINLFYTKSNLITDKEAENQLDYKNYEDNWNWYVFLDEAHKWDKETSNSQKYFNIFTRNGFLFNFSATFVDETDIGTTAYNFNLAEFIKSGNGKNIYISDSEFLNFNNKNDLEYNSLEKNKIILKSIITYSCIKKIYNELKQIDENIYHNPLMITFWFSVYTDNADIEIFLKILKNLAEWNFNKNDFENIKNEILKEYKSELNVLFYDKKLNISYFKEILEKINLDDIYKLFFNSEKSGEIEYKTISWNNQEILFQLKSSSRPFALIKIWDVNKLEKDKLAWIKWNKTPFSSNDFNNLNDKNSDINILLGTTSFYEWWDTNRPNIINYVNIWKTSNAEKFILQSVWRWIRIKTIEAQRKRIEFIKKNIWKIKDNKIKENIDKISKKSQALETLFIFSTNKSDVIKVISELEKNDTNKWEFKILDLFEKNNNPIYKKNLTTNKDNNKKFKISEENYKKIKKYIENKSNIILLLDNQINIKNIKLLDLIFKIENKEKYFITTDSDNIDKNPKILLNDIISFFNYHIYNLKWFEKK